MLAHGTCRSPIKNRYRRASQTWEEAAETVNSISSLSVLATKKLLLMVGNLCRNLVTKPAGCVVSNTDWMPNAQVADEAISLSHHVNCHFDLSNKSSDPEKNAVFRRAIGSAIGMPATMSPCGTDTWHGLG